MQSWISGLIWPQPERIRTREPPKPHELGLQPLVQPNEQTEPLIDIVAVHGIGAHPYYSWLYSERISKASPDGSPDATMKREVHWLKDKDMLPGACPDSRIMTFGYESQWFGDGAIKQKLSSVADSLLKALRSERKECPLRPLLFIGHCFGGLVIQKALVVARLQDHNSPGIFSSTCGVVFMGTPHRGTASITSQGMMYAIIAQEPECFIEDSVLEALRAESDALTSARKEFVDLCNHEDVKLPLVCFYEQKITSVGRIIGKSGMREYVVDATSGSIDGFPSYGLGLDHFNLNKFSGPNDSYYKSVRDEIVEMVQRTRPQERTLRTADPPQDRLDCLKSLAFEDMDKLELGSPKALDGTCTWLFKHWLFRRYWLDGDIGILWILGGPGTGKTTLMKTVYLQTKEQYASSDVAVIGFSFTQQNQWTHQSSDPEGNSLSRSSVGLYRSLLHQLFSQSPQLLAKFLPQYRKKRDTKGTKWKWHDEELRDHFVELATGSEMKSTFVFIDALDECELRTAKEVVNQFKDAVKRAGHACGRLRICFSNRLHPDHSDNSPDSIRVEEHNSIDIKNYVSKKLFKVSKGKNAGAYQRLGNEIPRRAKGVFLWVALVVEMLNEKYDEGGYSPKKMTDMLQSVPDGLHPLFRRIIKKIKREHLAETVQIVRWILYASRPLTLKELRYAMGFEKGCDAGQCWRSQSEFENSDTFPLEDMERIIRSRTAGLIEVSHPERTSVIETQASPGLDLVQISAPDLGQSLENAALHRNTFREGHIPMHESLDNDLGDDSESTDSSDSSYDGDYESPEGDFDVRPRSSKKQYVQFFHHSAKEFFRKTGLQIFGNSTQKHDDSKSQSKLSRACVSYLKIDELRHVKFETQDYRCLEAPNHTAMKKLFRAYPFLHYAIHSWIKHAEYDNSSKQSSASLIEDFVGSCQTLNKSILNHWVDQCNQGQCNMEDEVDILSSLLYIAAATNLTRCIEPILHMCRVRHNPKVSSALDVAMHFKHTEITRKLLQGGANVDSKGMNGRTPLIIATRENEWSIVTLLIEKGADLEQNDDEGSTALLHAVRRGHVAIVTKLLHRGASCQHADNMSRTALHYAAAQGHPNSVLELLRAGASPNTQDINKATPLHAAILARKREVVQLLLRNGADIAVRDSTFLTPLSKAIKERPEMTQIMLQTCIKMIRDDNRKMCISLARALTSTTLSNDTPLHLLMSQAQICKKDENVKDVTVLLLNAANLLEKVHGQQDSILQILSQIRNEHGNTVLELAMSTNDSQLVQLLRESLATANGDHRHVASWPTGKHHHTISPKRSYTQAVLG